MNDVELHEALEARGYAKEHNGGNTHVYRKGGIVVSGADGDLPNLHWYCIGIYVDWQSGDECWHNFTDCSDEPDFADMGAPRNLWADLSDAELIGLPEFVERATR